MRENIVFKVSIRESNADIVEALSQAAKLCESGEYPNGMLNDGSCIIQWKTDREEKQWLK